MSRVRVSGAAPDVPEYTRPGSRRNRSSRGCVEERERVCTVRRKAETLYYEKRDDPCQEWEPRRPETSPKEETRQKGLTGKILSGVVGGQDETKEGSCTMTDGIHRQTGDLTFEVPVPEQLVTQR